MKLINNLILVEPLRFDRIGNIFIPENADTGKYVNVCGIVRAIPDHLIYNENHPSTLHVFTEYDLRVGDIIFYHFTCAEEAKANGMFMEYDGKNCMLVNVRDCYVSKRGDEIILHNGFCLGEPIDTTLKSSLILMGLEKNEDNKDMCKIAYLSKPIKEYKWGNEWKVIPPDDDTIKVGDIVKLMRYGGRLLEQLSDNLVPGKKFYFFQRRDVVGIVKDNEINCVSNRVLIKEDSQLEKIGSIYIPQNIDSRSKKSKWGTIVSAGPISGFNTGDHVCYDYGFGTPVEHNKSEYYCMLGVHILYA